jgi:hypothetical protein
MNNRNPVLLVAIGLVVLAGAFYKFALSPKQTEASDVKAKVTSAEDRLSAARELLSSNEEARQTFRSAFSTVVSLGKAVPSDDDVRSLIVQLDRAAEKTFVDFQSIEVAAATGVVPVATTLDPAAAVPGALPPGATVGPAGFPVMPFTFSFRGRFFRLGAFFAHLDDFVKTSNAKVDVTGRLLTVEGIKLEPDTTGFPNIKATVTATAYLVSPLEGATGGATAAGPAGLPGAAPAPTDPATAPTTTTATIR